MGWETYTSLASEEFWTDSWFLKVFHGWFCKIFVLLALMFYCNFTECTHWINLSSSLHVWRSHFVAKICLHALMCHLKELLANVTPQRWWPHQITNGHVLNQGQTSHINILRVITNHTDPPGTIKYLVHIPPFFTKASDTMLWHSLWMTPLQLVYSDQTKEEQYTCTVFRIDNLWNKTQRLVLFFPGRLSLNSLAGDLINTHIYPHS